MIKNVTQLTWDIVSGIIVVGLDLLTGHWSKAWTDIKSYVGKIWLDIKTVVSDGWNGIVQLASTWYSTALSWGKNVVQGIIDGIVSLASNLASTVADLADRYIVQPFKHAAGINSPSRVMAEQGRYLLLGLHQGMTDQYHLNLIERASNQLVNAAVPDTFDRYGYGGYGGGDVHFHGDIIIQGANKDAKQLADELMRELGVRTRTNNMSRPIGPNRLVFN
ncbi:hypothetical protein DNHGIG_23920 [Collibacillus ludicampi]|uniref:Uncharacterized protein n=1 Tax=Collibacillus ludicampi TaxID=2771369 RepID=A0AAV4LGQ8_9BACL|nr:hypothetical protein [Collibacillus ludicampi]GIM46843.1 hypothetical protein DNHGIG_23920 [Collibacillus ludicampi]